MAKWLIQRGVKSSDELCVMAYRASRTLHTPEQKCQLKTVLIYLQEKHSHQPPGSVLFVSSLAYFPPNNSSSTLYIPGTEYTSPERRARPAKWIRLLFSHREEFVDDAKLARAPRRRPPLSTFARRARADSLSLSLG